MRELHQRFLKINNKPYGIYKSLLGQFFSFGDFTLKFTHIQGDPHASYSKIMLSAKIASLGFTEDLYNTKEKEIALSDFLLRQFTKEIENINIVKAHSQIMQRNSLYIENGIVYVLVSVNLPGENRRIEGEKASELLIGTLSDYLTVAMYWNNINKEKCKEHIDCLLNRNFLLSQLEEHNLVAFVPNNAILPRESSVSESPMQDAVPFTSPKELQLSLKLLNGTKIEGMGIPKGISIIVGGGFHGKSTLLHALEDSVYPHVPGDGREFIVIDKTATPVKTEEGRVVNGTDISALVKELPFNNNVESFTTKNASGATSQVANLLEAVELGARTILIDEDASAVNFLIRDLRMRSLIEAKKEPLIPLTDRIKDFVNSGINFIIVVGACGDYISLANTVIAFNEYKAECLTEKAKGFKTKEPESNEIIFQNRRIDTQEFQKELVPNSTVEKNVKIRVFAGQITIGKLRADLRKFPIFCNTELQRGIAEILHNLIRENPGANLKETLEIFCQKLPKNDSNDLILPRVNELGAAFLRL